MRRAAAGGFSKSVTRGICLSGHERVAHDDAGLLREHDLETSRFQRGAIERALIAVARGRDHDAVAECVFAAGVDRDPRLPPALHVEREHGERPVVVEMTMAEDERVGAGGIDSQHAVVVEQGAVGEREVEEDFSLLGAATGLQVVGETVLGQERRIGIHGRSLHADRVELSCLREDVVDVVDDVRHHEPVHRRRGAGLRGGGRAAEPLDAAEGERGGAHGTQSQQIASVHGYT